MVTICSGTVVAVIAVKVVAVTLPVTVVVSVLANDLV